MSSWQQTWSLDWSGPIGRDPAPRSLSDICVLGPRSLWCSRSERSGRQRRKPGTSHCCWNQGTSHSRCGSEERNTSMKVNRMECERQINLSSGLSMNSWWWMKFTGVEKTTQTLWWYVLHIKRWHHKPSPTKCCLIRSKTNLFCEKLNPYLWMYEYNNYSCIKTCSMHQSMNLDEFYY